MYSTNAIESLNARFRKAAVRRGHFPTEQAAIKVLYLVSIERRKNRSNPTGRINAWKQILNTLTIHHGDHPPRRPPGRPQPMTPTTPDTQTPQQSHQVKLEDARCANELSVSGQNRERSVGRPSPSR